MFWVGFSNLRCMSEILASQVSCKKKSVDIPPRFNPTQKVKNCMTRIMLQNRTLHISVVPCLSATECDGDLLFDQDRDLWLTTHRMKQTPHSGQLVLATATLLPHDAGILKPRCMSEIRHHKPQQRLNLGVPLGFDPRDGQNLQQSRHVARASRKYNRFGRSVPSQRSKQVLRSRLRPCFTRATHNRTKTPLECATPLSMADNDRHLVGQSRV